MCLLTVGFLSNTVAMNSEIANGLDKIKNIESKWIDRIVGYVGYVGYVCHWRSLIFFGFFLRTIRLCQILGDDSPKNNFIKRQNFFFTRLQTDLRRRTGCGWRRTGCGGRRTGCGGRRTGCGWMRLSGGLRRTGCGWLRLSGGVDGALGGPGDSALRVFPSTTEVA